MMNGLRKLRNKNTWNKKLGNIRLFSLGHMSRHWDSHPGENNCTLSGFCLFLTIIHKLLIQKYSLLFLIIRMLFYQVLLQCSFGIILFATKFTYKKFLGPCMEKHVATQCFLSHVPFGALGAAKLFCFFFLEPNHVYF